MNGFVVGKSYCAALTALAIASAPSLALAQETPKQKALAFYEQAVAAYQKGDYATAASLLERAFAIDPDRDLIYKYNRILALEKLGEFKKALDELDPFLEPMLADPDRRFDDAGELQQRLKKKLEAQQQSKDPTDPKDPNNEVKDPGAVAESDPPILAFTLIGVGGALLITGLIFGSGQLLDERPDANGPQDRIDAYNSKLSTHKTVTLVGLIGGALIAGGGVALLLLDDSGDSDAPTNALLPSPKRIHITPAVGLDSAGAVFEMRF